MAQELATYYRSDIRLDLLVASSKAASTTLGRIVFAESPIS